MRKLTYDEAYKLAKENYCKGGDGFVECVSREDYETGYNGMYSRYPATRAGLLREFREQYDHEQDVAGWFDY